MSTSFSHHLSVGTKPHLSFICNTSLSYSQGFGVLLDSLEEQEVSVISITDFPSLIPRYADVFVSSYLIKLSNSWRLM